MFASLRQIEYSAPVNQLREFKASIFQALAHPTRLQILEVLRDGELSVNAILSKIERDQANISQHLASLRLRGLLVNRKGGNQVFYSVRDPVLFKVLDLMRRYSTTHFNEHMALLKRIKTDDSR
jgi:ArsR family transcriptional regulator